ncbi:CSC1-like protein At1g32090 isoform X2 [Oryza brachyantha]|uniref:CSC1-like protein At1g32090 isoform X2 n=1 Tax=Oryza brachyantha TaxID=4533 RepID=UPI001ADB45FA|nr:CSC1-like protein At1g32090 isoform X2 [Oryza brachyantha]
MEYLTSSRALKTVPADRIIFLTDYAPRLLAFFHGGRRLGACLKIFLPITTVALLVLIPINVSGGTLLNLRKEVVFSDIDKLSISNVSPGSNRFFIHLLMAYVFTFWTCFMLYKEYSNVAFMRLHFLASQKRCADHFTVIVRNIPHVSSHSTSETVDEFFRRNHPDHYLGQQAVYNANRYAKLVKQKERLQNWLDYYQLKLERHSGRRPIGRTGCLGFCGREVDQIDYYHARISELDKKLASERQRVLNDPKAVMPVAFVTFDSRWGAAVCAQTQQSKNPTQWLTDWAPEPRDVYWENLAIPFFSLSIRKFLISVAVFALVFFYMIPIAFVQSLANLEGIEKVAPFLRPVIEARVVKSFLQGFLPGLALKIFLYILPTVLMIMSKVEGYVSLSSLERRAASKYYYFMLVNVFLGSIIAGTAFEQLYAFFHQPPTQIPRTIGVAIPMKATFFMTYIMVDGWAGIANEILRVKPLVIYHLKNMFIVKTERDREKAMDPGSIGLAENLPSLQLYFLLGLVYAVVTPILLPFIIIFFAFAFLVYRHQIINVYNQEYESAAAFWPQVHSRIIASLLISHVTLFGLMSTMRAAYSTPLLIFLPLLTIWFHKYCKSRFEPAFRKYPLEEAMEKDNLERASEPNLNLKSYLANAYLHPIFHMFEQQEEQQQQQQEKVEVRIDKAQQQQQHRQVQVEEEEESKSSQQATHYHHHHEQTTTTTTHHHYPHHEHMSRSSSQYDSASPPHFVYHYGIDP